ncbi:shikimate dehydrogenase [Patescibacteria group bacterium]|nr:shikimate dehydrogenase [Patescibacteria group bacterium]
MSKKYGILAYPAGHSLSPVMHNAAFRQLGIDAQYGVFEKDEGELSDFMKYVVAEPVYGLSVSLPHKETIRNFLNEEDEAVQALGACNTVKYQGGFLHGYNTDWVGSNMALEEACGELSGKTAVVIGAGGAARAVVYGLLKAGVKVAAIYNRNKERAQELAGDFSEEIFAGGLDEMEASADILVQASSIWTLNEEAKLEDLCSLEFIKGFSCVMDLVYKPLLTPLLVAAQDLGKTIVTGEKMLLYQAAKQFEIWTEEKAPIKVMREALENNLV